MLATFLVASFVTADANAAYSPSNLILKQLHVVTRHGSRLQLRKGDNLKEFTEGPLTTLGQKQAYDLGVWIKRRYNQKTNSSSSSPAFFDVYQLDKVRLESSSFERTIITANTLALGLFNASARDPLHESLLPSTITPAANVPVYTRAVENDYIIRAYDKCPDGLDLKNLYQGLAFQSLAKQYSKLLTKLGSYLQFSPFTGSDGGSIAVSQVWNVYDSIEVAKTECGGLYNGSTCTDDRKKLLTLLTDRQWKDLQDVARQAEFLKYGSQTAGRLIGGNLMQLILSKMDETNTTIGADLDGFYLYSAHYPTILGLLAALEEDPVNKESIPSYAAALIFELYVDPSNGEKLFQVLYRPGVKENGLAVIKPVILDAICPTTSNSSSSAICPLHYLNEYFANYTLASWCKDCGSTADVCSQFAAAAAPNCQAASGSKHFTGVAGLLTGLLVGLIGMASVWYVGKRSRTSGGQAPAQIKPPVTEADEASSPTLMA
jgi:hypothetical protein